MQAHIAQKLDQLPDGPGVYIMKDKNNTIFYIGKAKNLNNRVKSYFTGTDTRKFVSLLDRLLDDLEVILTKNEKEALILEDNLIKTHRPRFNVKLIDDKRYVCLRIDHRQDYPRLQVVRRLVNDGAHYFGPYHSASAIRETLRLINRYFQLRTCTDQTMRTRLRPCILHQIKRCPAPCVYDLKQDKSYHKNVDNVIRFLEGRSSVLLADLQQRMENAAAAEQYELAATWRDQIQAINRSLERQQLVTADFKNRDIIGFYREGPAIELYVMRVRQGKMIDAKRFSLDNMALPTPDILADFASRLYCQTTDVPEEILFPAEMEWGAALSEMLSDNLCQHQVSIITPQRGHKAQMLMMAMKNAKQAFGDQQRAQGQAKNALETLQQVLKLTKLPQRLECCDISHLQGSHIVASMVCLQNGVIDKSQYRRYHIRSTLTQDDFQSIYEVVSRRIRRGMAEKNLPDLLVIDGGKGQLDAAARALAEQQCAEVEVIALAKARTFNAKKQAQKGVTGSFERVFCLGENDPIVLPENSAALFMLVRARDEAHRFALKFHRNLRARKLKTSPLDQIKGLGPVKKKKLLRTFGSIKQIQAASLAQLSECVGKQVGLTVYHALRAPDFSNPDENNRDSH